ncbi:response regulator transcription factor [Shewanella sp. NIFS-20-20]|uniref:response regulator transcription factor n=1 Tax=Shewanella sp. NIFS-20-20 TaxID=2853806 RepID=UPI001C455A0C|nr:response regulator [Shewanella sp. NIFS-20-20]MBV7314199.1 response regulator [Shewanella sp. NIFS-20-20]
MEKLTIWVVDDDKDYGELMSEVLTDDYHLRVYENAKDYEAALLDSHPDIILMDINLPDKDGVTLCQELQGHQSNIAVVFVSGMNTLEERVRSYDAGGVDFVAKPFEIKELLFKVSAVASYQQKQKSLMHAENMSRNMAFQSMTESAQYGYVMQFFRQFFLCNDYQSLADAFFDLMAQFSLNTCLEIVTDKPEYFAPAGMPISPIETNILELLDKQGRLYDFGNRTVCSDKHVSFLIKNMPMNDEVLYGRIRDVIAVVVEGVEARVMDIRREKAMSKAIIDIKMLLKQLGKSISENDEKFHQALQKINADIHSSFHVLDMSEEQEDYFASIVKKNLKQANSAQDAFLHLQRSLNTVMSVLETTSD